MINRLIEPSSGHDHRSTADVSTLPAHELRRGIGYVIQQSGLFPHRTVLANVATVPRLLGWDKARAKARATDLLDLVGLDADASPTATRPSCRAASSSASVSPGPSPPTRRCC